MSIFCTTMHGMSESPKLFLINTTTWKIEITQPERTVIEPGHKYSFTRLPGNISFRPYGKVWGYFGQEHEININTLLNQKGLPELKSISSKNNIVVTIRTEGIKQSWAIDITIEPNPETHSKILSEIEKDRSPLVFFPRLQERKEQKLTPQEEARYILALPTSYNNQELTSAYQSSFINLDKVLRNQLSASYKPIIDQAIELLNHAKIILEKIDLHTITQPELASFHQLVQQAKGFVLPQTKVNTFEMQIFKDRQLNQQVSEFREKLLTELNQTKFPFRTYPEVIDMYPKVRRYEFEGGIFFPDILHGAPIRISSIDQAKNPDEKKLLTQQYKIHLMPRDEDFKDSVLALLNAIKREKDLQETISTLKIKPIPETIIEQIKEPAQKLQYPNSEVWRLPKIILYILGKDAAQRALNKIFELFKDRQGLDRAPAFNRKVTSLIYFAQGNRDDKMKYPEVFEKGEMIYFDPKFNGQYEDFHLINPATKTRD